MKGSVTVTVSNSVNQENAPQTPECLRWFKYVKPYLPFADCVEGATGGYAAAHEAHALQVDFPESLLLKIPEEKRQGLIEALTDDPRPSYQNDASRIYGMRFGDNEIKFSIASGVLSVLSVE